MHSKGSLGRQKAIYNNFIFLFYAKNPIANDWVLPMIGQQRYNDARLNMTMI
jgi:hypothetical protein